MFPFSRFLLACFFPMMLLLNLSEARAQEDNWTHFRGTNLNGISEDCLVPVSWNDTTNVIWKTDIRGKGWSSPVVEGNQVWLTTATANGKEMSAICVDLITGKLLFDILLFKQDSIYRKHSINTYATPTPCIEQGFVYLNFGSSGTACVSMVDGKIIWKRDDLKVEHVQGTGASPIIYKDFLIVHYEGTDQQFIVALSKKTGETVWRTDRPKECYDPLQPIGKKAYTTPIVINVDGRDLLISNGSAVCIAYEVASGKEVWRVVQGEDSTIAMPLYEDGVVFFYTSFVTPAEGEKYCELMAVDPKGTGDVSKTNVIWRVRSPMLQLLTPLVKDGLIYTVDARNNLVVIGAKNGIEIFRKSLKNK